MSIIFKPNIPECFSFNEDSAVIKKVTEGKATRRRKPKLWLPEELTMLVELRALAVPHRDIGLILKRRHDDCATAVNRHDLQLAIRIKRKQLIAAVRD